jgi:DNA repair photolyase
MGLNKSKGNMYEWLTHTWNPLAGECPHKCSYCSTNKLMRYPGIKNKYTGPPRLHEPEIKTNIGENNFIFIVAQNDLFAEKVPSDAILKVIHKCHEYSNNTYLFQTKNPQRIFEFASDLSGLNFRLCTTIETNRLYEDVMKNCPLPEDRAEAMNELAHEFNFGFPNNEMYVTIEPIMDFDLNEMSDLIETCLPAQVNIGADSGNNNLPEPSKEKILALISKLEKFTKVKQKSNLARLLK